MYSLSRHLFYFLTSSLFLFSAAALSPGDSYAQGPTEKVAVVNGRDISLAEVESYSRMPSAVDDPQKKYAIRKVAIDNFVVKLLLEEEAARRSISVFALRAQMSSGQIEIPEAKVDAEYASNAPYFGLLSPDEAREKLRLLLINDERMKLYRNALAELRRRAKIEILLKEPVRTRTDSEPNVDPSKSGSSAKLVITEFSDFRCPYCRMAQEPLRRVLSEYKDSVELVYKHLPLETSPQGLLPAIAATCAKSQNRFREFHDKLFLSAEFDAAAIRKIAREASLDLAGFEACLASDESRKAVLSDYDEALRLGITSTPTFIINGRIHRGSLSFDELKSIIDGHLGATPKAVRN